MTAVDALVDRAAAFPFVVAVLVVVVGLVRLPTAGKAAPAKLAASIRLALEFLLAAGLLRLSAIDSYTALTAVAAIALVRKLVATGMRFSLQAIGMGGSAEASPGPRLTRPGAARRPRP